VTRGGERAKVPSAHAETAPGRSPRRLIKAPCFWPRTIFSTRNRLAPTRKAGCEADVVVNGRAALEALAKNAMISF